MKKSLFKFINLLAISFIWLSSTYADVSSTAVLPIPELIKSLQDGGHVIYLRHATTNHSQKDRERQNLGSCDQQRNLSPTGREQAKVIGKAIRKLGIPIGKVASSPYCRCKDTAELGFGHYEIEPDLQFSISKDENDAKMLGERLRHMMMMSEVNGVNAVFVGHTSNLRDGLGVWPKPEGVAAVFQKWKDDLIFRGFIKPDEWL